MEGDELYPGSEGQWWLSQLKESEYGAAGLVSWPCVVYYLRGQSGQRATDGQPEINFCFHTLGTSDLSQSRK
jgi:hypothetical protein